MAEPTVEQAIEATADRCRNWGRFGDEDILGTLNFIDDAMRVHAAGLVRHGAAFSLAIALDDSGPQTGAWGRVNPIHAMVDVTDGIERRRFPHGFGGADDVVFMPLQCATHWDGLGHIFDRGRHGTDAWPARPSP